MRPIRITVRELQDYNGYLELIKYTSWCRLKPDMNVSFRYQGKKILAEVLEVGITALVREVQ